MRPAGSVTAWTPSVKVRLASRVRSRQTSRDPLRRGSGTSNPGRTPGWAAVRATRTSRFAPEGSSRE